MIIKDLTRKIKVAMKVANKIACGLELRPCIYMIIKDLYYIYYQERNIATYLDARK